MSTPPPPEPAEPAAAAEPAAPQADPQSPPPAAQRSLPMPRLFIIMAAVIGAVLLLGNFGIGLPGAPLTPRDSRTAAPAVPASGVPASGVPASGVPASGVPASGVPWDDYESDLKSRLDAFAQLGDCADLKRQLNAADRGNDATIANTGHDNSALMAYIAAKMQEVGCTGS